MPGKIPVFRSLGAGIRFLVVHFPGIVRASVLPGLLVAAALFGLYWFILPVAPRLGLAQMGFGGAENPFYGLPFVVIYVAATLMLSIGLAKVYFKQPIGAIYARFGRPELLLLGATFTVILLTFLVSGLPLLGMALAVFSMVDPSAFPEPTLRHVPVAETTPESDGMSIFVALGLGVLVLAVLYVFLALRLGLFLPVVVKENRFGVWRSWKLMRGNVWRVIWLSLLMLIPAFLFLIPVGMLAYSALFAVTGEEADMIILNGPLSLESFLTLPGLVMLGANGLSYLVITSLYVGAFCFAYAKLAEDDAQAAG